MNYLSDILEITNHDYRFRIKVMQNIKIKWHESIE